MANLFTGLLLGATLGMWISHWAWKAKLRDKIRSGIRLELDGKLYDITRSNSANPPQFSTEEK